MLHCRLADFVKSPQLSTRLTLRPGDVIATGTPAGCGAARGIFLKCGDRATISVDSLGTLTSDFGS
jgi:2-keto-4-pentenoate hydratase/2-oxohepta-3-ene-1,7-dioic acid hydratase in catechol pathway